MATITLTGNTLSGRLGIGSFTSMGNSFSNARNSTTNLSNELGTLRNKIDAVNTSVNIDGSQAAVAKTREENKSSALTCGYDRLDTLVSDVGVVDNKTATEVEKLKNNFYKKYSYLKPESEKSWWDRLKDGATKLWDGICDINNKINKFFCDVIEWCKEHIVEIIVALIVVLIAVVLVVFAGFAVAFVCAVAGLISLAMTVADVVCMICNDGKDIATTLEENGHPFLAKVYRGVSWGCDLVQIVLPLGAAVKSISTMGFKTFFKTTWSAFKSSLKETYQSIFKSGFKDGLKNFGKLLFKTFVVDIDDLKTVKATKLLPLKDMSSNFKVDGDRLIPVSDEAKSALNKYGKEFLTLKNGDVDWKSISIFSAKMDMGDIGVSVADLDNYLSGNLTEQEFSKKIRAGTYNLSKTQLAEDLGISKNQVNSMLSDFSITPHDHYSTKVMYFVPTEIHSLVSHNGAIAVYKNSIKTVSENMTAFLSNLGSYIFENVVFN